MTVLIPRIYPYDSLKDQYPGSLHFSAVEQTMGWCGGGSMTGTETAIVLTDEERELIQEVLEERHRTLLMEIAHTDHHHFKAVLRKKADVLENVLSRFMVQA